VRLASSYRPWAVVIVLLSTAASARAAYVTMIDNGPSSNRVDIVFLGDGYTAADHAAGTYVDHINSYAGSMFADTANSSPYYRYRNFFNVHRVNVTSNESGADIPPEGIYRDTALNASYYWDGSTERLLYVSTSAANAARDAGLAGAEFTAEMQYVTVNHTKYGGGGGSYAVFAGGNSSANELALHEVAHSFSHLADEYGGYAGPYTGPEPAEVNVTKDPTGAKWSRWLGYDQPGIGVIGAYEGGRYYDTGIYRPSLSSKMRDLNRPFDAVGRERIILDIYDLVDPLDEWLDNSSSLTNPDELFVQCVDSDVLEIEWLVDGTKVAGATGETFDLLAAGYGAGDYSVEAHVFDPTGFDPVDGWVRMNQTELEQSVMWSVTLSVPEPTMIGVFLGMTLMGAFFARRRQVAVGRIACRN